jgi:hypothetical protein
LLKLLRNADSVKKPKLLCSPDIAVVLRTPLLNISHHLPLADVVEVHPQLWIIPHLV